MCSEDSYDSTCSVHSPARPLSPPASDDKHASIAAHLPFAIFAPDASGVTDPKRFFRRFAWGEADALDPKQSDFLTLRDAMLGSHAKVSGQS